MKVSRACLPQRLHVLAAEVSTEGLVRTSFSLPDTGSRSLPLGQRNLLGPSGQGTAMASVRRH